MFLYKINSSNQWSAQLRTTPVVVTCTVSSSCETLVPQRVELSALMEVKNGARRIGKPMHTWDGAHSQSAQAGDHLGPFIRA